jgi:hypothetical protein
MTEKNEKRESAEGNPRRGDAILQRMLKTPPKPHKDMKKGKAQKADPKANAGLDRAE